MTGQDSWDRTTETGQPWQDSLDRTERTEWPENDSEGRHPGQDSRKWPLITPNEKKTVIIQPDYNINVIMSQLASNFWCKAASGSFSLHNVSFQIFSYPIVSLHMPNFFVSLNVNYAKNARFSLRTKRNFASVSHLFARRTLGFRYVHSSAVITPWMSSFIGANTEVPVISIYEYLCT